MTSLSQRVRKTWPATSSSARNSVGGGPYVVEASYPLSA